MEGERDRDRDRERERERERERQREGGENVRQGASGDWYDVEGRICTYTYRKSRSMSGNVKNTTRLQNKGTKELEQRRIQES